MLSFLSILNLAVIDRVEMEFRDGFTALTGETGAGKSILLDALQLALGERADSGLVRDGQKRAEVVAGFRALGAELGGWLDEHELDTNDELLLRRVVNADGGSRAWINGTPVPIQVLKELGQRLVEIHGQHEHQFLQRPAYQLELLDAYAAHGGRLEELATLFHEWRRNREALETLRAESALSPAERELLEFQIEELERDALSPEDLETLEDDHRRLAHAGELIKASDRVSALLDGEDDGAAERVAQALRELGEVLRFAPALGEVRDLLDTALIQLREAAAELSRQQDGIDLDPSRLEALDAQLGRIHQLARKHRVEATDLGARLDELRARHERAADSDQAERRLMAAQSDLESRYRSASEALSGSRRKAAAELAGSVTGMMAELGMSDGCFEVDVTFDAERPLSPAGQDSVAFKVSTNPGSATRPLARVASGGELSRISLAIKVVAADLDGVGTMIFDEVDAGVGGGTAQIVGEKLRRVSRDRQVLCVTHLPQVAACAHQQVRISKGVEKGASVTQVLPLDDQQRVDEIARMLGGLEVTERATEHARELIEAGRTSRD